MRIDYEAKRLACSVNDLIYESGYRRIGVERGDGFRRMWIGQDIHTRRADERAGEDRNYRSEAWVTHTASIAGWEATVSGRIDGLSVDKEAKTIVIEEVKSLHFDLELSALMRSDKLQRHLYQLMLYSWFLSNRPEYDGFELRPQLVLIDIITGDTRLLEAPLELGDVRSAFKASVAGLIEGIESRAALQAAKRAFADGLPFPYSEMRPYQNDMMEAVARAVRQNETLLVSAPTGVGKTIAAIYPALRESLRLGKKLFYLTSKTLQQENAVTALRMMNDGSFRVLRVRAKQKMCAHTEMICHENFCPYAANYGEKMDRTGLVSRIVTDHSYFDPDVTFEMAKSEEVCPFEVSLELIDQADVIICDYNYVFDPYVGLKAFQQESDYSDCVLIIDEAHNLLDRGRGYYSPEIDEAMLENVRLHLLSRSCDLDGWDEQLEELRNHIRGIAEVLSSEEEYVAGEMQIGDAIWPPAWGAQATLSLTGTARPQVRKQALCDLNGRFFLRQRAEWERIILRYITWKIEQRIADEKDPVIDFYFKLVKFTNLVADGGEELAPIIESGERGLKLKIFCKDPSRFLGEIIDSTHATIAISATLEPFEFYRTTLGFPRDRVAELSLPSPFPRENRRVAVIADVDTTYKARGAHYGRIAERIAELASSTAGNFLALFPSYAFLGEVVALMPPTGCNVLVQRSDMTDYERQSILERLRAGGRGNLVLAVSGGMYAEGIDYQGEMLSGVFVVGPALPMVTFEQELLKQYYEEHYGAGFEYAYLIPGMTRVVQSAGRVIRSETDIGVIVLLCKRFTQPRYTRYFPADWYVESPRELVAKRAADDMRDFFETKRRGQLSMFQ
ncbi:MAG TPA: ATP-dependent DNA helicase [Thermoanaerobaculia bacterium]|nr:ATP-dependent DNA helicase [Thermoanaerobaculia bacterium]